MDRAVLDLLAFYQKEIRETKEGRAALAKLHIDSPEVVEHFGLGYATGNALKAASEDQYRLYVSLGLARNRRERFHGRVVIPVHDEDDKLVDLCGLILYGSGLRFDLWQEPLRGLIGIRSLRTYPEIILTDNPFHALHVRQHGFPNVVALRKVDELRHHIGTFERHGIERVYLVSRQQRKRIIPILEGAGIEVVTITMPSNKVIVPKSSFDIIGKKPLEKQKAAAVKLVARTATRLHFEAGGVSYKLESLAATGLGMRVQIRAEHQGVAFIDRADLASASARRKYARSCASRLGATACVLEDHLAGIAANIDEMEVEGVEKESAPRVLSDCERKAAMKALSKRDALRCQADALEKLYHFVSEPANKRLALLVAASRLLPKPLGAIIRGPAGCGKSSLMQAVSRILPSSDVLNLSRLTPQALYFMPKDSLHHKLLIVDEYEGLADTEYAVRTIMSNQSLSLAITVREGGRLPVTKTIEIPATLAVLVSTTGSVNVENLSRFIELRMDASARQTERVMVALAKQQANNVNAPKRRAAIEALQDANSLLKPCAVEIPFADKLTFAARSVLARRQFAQVVGLVSAHAALFQHQRETHESEGHLTVTATKADYEAVHPLLGSIIEHYEEDVSPPAMQLLERLGDRKAKAFTRRDVMRWTGWSYSKTHRILSELSALDLLIPDTTTNGVLRQYEPAPYFRSERGISQIAPPEAV